MTSLEAFREQHKLSYRQLTRVLGNVANGFSKSAVHRICTGKQDATAQQQERINAVMSGFTLARQHKETVVIIIPAGQTFEVEVLNTEGKRIKHLTLQG